MKELKVDVLSVQGIKNSRKEYTCDNCKKEIKVGDPYSRGYAKVGGRQVPFFVCDSCAKKVFMTEDGDTYIDTRAIFSAYDRLYEDDSE